MRTPAGDVSVMIGFTIFGAGLCPCILTVAFRINVISPEGDYYYLND